jgi:hypothetical protein
MNSFCQYSGHRSGTYRNTIYFSHFRSLRVEEPYVRISGFQSFTFRRQLSIGYSTKVIVFGLGGMFC